MSDPRKADMNKEIADLYKRENVNPDQRLPAPASCSCRSCLPTTAC